MQKSKIIEERIDVLEKKLWKIEKLIWYVAGIISLKTGTEIIPMVSAWLGNN